MCSYAHSNIEIHHLNFSSRNMVLILSSRNIVIFKVKGQCQIFRREDMPRFALPLLFSFCASPGELLQTLKPLVYIKTANGIVRISHVQSCYE